MYLIEIHSDVVGPPVASGNVTRSQHVEESLGVVSARIDSIGVGGEVVLYDERPARIIQNCGIDPSWTRAAPKPAIPICINKSFIIFNNFFSPN